MAGAERNSARADRTLAAFPGAMPLGCSIASLRAVHHLVARYSPNPVYAKSAFRNGVAQARGVSAGASCPVAAADASPRPAVCGIIRRSRPRRTDDAGPRPVGGVARRRGVGWSRSGVRCRRGIGRSCDVRRLGRRGLLDLLRRGNGGLFHLARILPRDLSRRVGSALAVGAFGRPPGSHPLGFCNRGDRSGSGQDGEQQEGTHEHPFQSKFGG